MQSETTSIARTKQQQLVALWDTHRSKALGIGTTTNHYPRKNWECTFLILASGSSGTCPALWSVSKSSTPLFHSPASPFCRTNTLLRPLNQYLGEISALHSLKEAQESKLCMPSQTWEIPYVPALPSLKEIQAHKLSRPSLTCEIPSTP